ncbi:hypothetical protein [Kitasatospora sp. NPDC093102]|uniref:hypothetical protein n=1 Tax=Kitasatospora sp. NPDC093102 TaxID=3155069 RepID=UPI003436ADBE
MQGRTVGRHHRHAGVTAVDPSALFSEPNRDRYHTRTEREFGEKIGIPEPFGFELDLTRLVPYRD